MKKLRVYFLLLIMGSFLCGNVGSVCAEESRRGEIINVNFEYKIAFTDLNTDVLKEGDIVRIFKGAEVITFMAVDEVSTAISKLITIVDGPYATQENFKKVLIGFSVEKINPNGDIHFSSAPVHEIKPFFNQDVLKPIDDGYARKTYDTSVNVSSLLKEKKILETENGRLISELNISENKWTRLFDEKKSLEKKFKKMISPEEIKVCQGKVKIYQEALTKLKNKLKTMVVLMEGK